jgi:hypothetical protein
LDNPQTVKTSSFVGELYDFYDGIFSAMEELIDRHHTFASWSIGEIPKLARKRTQEEIGLWYAETVIPGFSIPFGIGLVLLPGELRVGIFIPTEATRQVGQAFSLEEAIDRAYDGNKGAIIRYQGDQVLFDRLFRQEPPFDVKTMLEAQRDREGPEWRFVVQRLAYMVTTIFVNTLRVIWSGDSRASKRYSVRSLRPVPPEAVRGMPRGVFLSTDEIEGGFLSHLRTEYSAEQVRQHLEQFGFGDVIEILTVDESLFAWGS